MKISYKKNSKITIKLLPFLAFIAALPFLSGCMGVEIIDTGHRGIKTRFGKIVGDPLPEGLYFYNPVTSSIVELDVREKKLTESTEAYTKDIQNVKITYSINFRPEVTMIHELYKEVGKDYAKIILPQIAQEELKNSIGRWDAGRLVEKRNEAVAQAENSLKEMASRRKIIITRFALTDLVFTDEFEKSVEAKVRAEQRAAEAKNKTVQVEEEAKQKVMTAEAEAKSMTIRAQALSQNKNLVEYEAVQKWNGVLPQYQMGGSIPFINIK